MTDNCLRLAGQRTSWRERGCRSSTDKRRTFFRPARAPASYSRVTTVWEWQAGTCVLLPGAQARLPGEMEDFYEANIRAW